MAATYMFFIANLYSYFPSHILSMTKFQNCENRYVQQFNDITAYGCYIYVFYSKSLFIFSCIHFVEDYFSLPHISKKKCVVKKIFFLTITFDYVSKVFTLKTRKNRIWEKKIFFTIGYFPPLSRFPPIRRMVDTGRNKNFFF